MKRILVPVDFSSATETVLALAAEIARALQAELHLVHVRELKSFPVFPAATIGYPGIGMPEMGLTGGVPVAPEVGAAPLPNEGESSQLAALQEALARQNLPARAHECDGAVVEEILRTAEEISADLIVMGSHGHGSVYNLLVGSVTEGVLKSGRRPVLLVPAPMAATK